MSIFEIIAKFIAGAIGFLIIGGFVIWMIILFWWIVLPIMVLAIAGALVKWALDY